jgi:hypothetical protein
VLDRGGWALVGDRFGGVVCLLVWGCVESEACSSEVEGISKSVTSARLSSPTVSLTS